MTQQFQIHPTNPQPRLVSQVVDVLQRGGLVVLPTDTTYVLACQLGDKRAQDRLRQLRRLPADHLLTLLVLDLASLATYAKVNNADFRVLKAHTPGPFTFVLQASREVPRRLLQPKRKTVGLRVPAAPICHAVLAGLGEPLLSTTLRLPQAELPITTADDAYEALARRVEVIVDGGAGGFEPTTLVDLVVGGEVLRQGAGEFE